MQRGFCVSLHDQEPMVKNIFEKTCNLLGATSSLTVLFIMLAIVVDVLGRAIFGAPLAGASEFAISGLVVVVFLGVASAQRNGHNFRVEFAVESLPKKLKYTLEILWRLIVLIVLCWIAWLTTQEAILSARKSEASYGVVAFPIWPSRILLTLGIWALVIQIALEISERLGSLGRPNSSQTVEDDVKFNEKDQ